MTIIKYNNHKEDYKKDKKKMKSFDNIIDQSDLGEDRNYKYQIDINYISNNKRESGAYYDDIIDIKAAEEYAASNGVDPKTIIIYLVDHLNLKESFYTEYKDLVRGKFVVHLHFEKLRYWIDLNAIAYDLASIKNEDYPYIIIYNYDHISCSEVKLYIVKSLLSEFQIKDWEEEIVLYDYNTDQEKSKITTPTTQK